MTTGLRQRKKAKTRAAIQHHALRLFREHGYDGTTVEQIADAAEISPSTFFRYFPNKEAVVLTDEYDPMIIAAVEAQPPASTPVQALRDAMREVFTGLPPAALEDMRHRSELFLTVPAIRAAFLSTIGEQVGLIASVLARRAGRAADDFDVRILAGAVFGALTAVLFHWLAHPEEDVFAEMDRALERLQAGALS